MRFLSMFLLMAIAISSCGQNEPQVIISTSYGDIKIKLYNDTPKHRDNFLKLASEGYYDGTLFHRIIDGFMIQGGDPDSKTAVPGQALGQGGPGYQIDAEFNPKHFHKKGALAAARMGDQVNPEKKSSGSQFYIAQGKVYPEADLKNLATRMPNLNEERIKAYSSIGGVPHLDDSYTVFGEVVEGLEVLDKISKVQKDNRDRPVEDIKMTVKVVK